MEIYRDRKAYEAHLGSDHFKNTRRQWRRW
nr:MULTISPECIES: antibiotic biosynthesis monooxygenase [unclassified Bradyrhizobium]